jgi:Do/DeqQ family serine protease
MPRVPDFIKTTVAAGGAALVVTLATISLSTTAPLPAHADIPPPVMAQAPFNSNGMPSLAPMIKTVLPSVVNIAVTSKVQMQNPLMADPMFRRFFNVPEQPPETEEAQSIGSGVIVDAVKGYIITNNHVVAQAEKVKIRLNDDRELDAKVVGTDPQTDVAVLQVKPDHLTALPMGDSDKMEVGDFVVAIGSPFNLRQTVTSGIVSALGRTTDNGDGGYQDFIQTDASINPGNSGGALVNMRGEVIGINSQIYSNSGGSIGIGFAIPINLAKEVMDQLVSNGKVERGRIGIMGGQDITPELAKALKLPDSHGALIGRVIPGSSADKAGLRAGDVIVEINGKAVHDFAQLRNTIGLMHIGEQVQLKLYRDGKTRDASVSIAKPTEETNKNVSPKLKGATFGPVQNGKNIEGVQVVAVEPRSPAAKLGLRQGDIIVAVNHQGIGDVGDLQKALAAAGDQAVLLQVQRGDVGLFIVIE